MVTARKIRNLSKLKAPFESLFDQFMFSVLLLLKKGLLLNEKIIDSLSKQNNIFKLNNFERFLRTEEAMDILKIFKDD